MLAIAAVLEGCPRGEAARKHGMDRQTLCDWVHPYNGEGIAGLTSRKSPGRAPLLSKEQQMQELKTLVVDGPDRRHQVAAIRSKCTSARWASGCAGLV